MTSYQKLKRKCEQLQGQVDLFKRALTMGTYKEPKIEVREDGTTYMSYFYTVYRNKIDYETKLRLNEWVAENIDEETIMRLLKMKKELENEAIKIMVD